jgi:PAS domain S-box-containing protein
MVRRRFERSAPLGNLSLTAKGILVVAIPVCALLLAMTVFFQLQRDTRAASGWVDHTFQVRSSIRHIMILLVNAETGTRGYLLSRQESFLKPYLDARRDLPHEFDNLAKLVADNPPQAERLTEVRKLSAAVQDAWERQRLDAASNNTKDLDAQLENARQQMEGLRQAVGSMQVYEDTLLRERTEAEQSAQSRLEAFVFAGGVLGLMGGVVSALLFATSIVRRVRHLEDDARTLAAGNAVEGDVGGHDEIARLGVTLKRASKLLVAREQELRAAHAELETRVKERTAELQATNEELHRSNSIRNAVVTSSPLSIWAIDLDGNVTFWNPAAERIFGWCADEVIGKPLPVVPDDFRAEYKEWLERFRLGVSIAGVERTRCKKDGSKIEVSIFTAPLHDEAGRIVGTITIDQDITDRRQLEEQFRQSQKLEAVGRLAGGVAHDFNNLLTVILGYVDMIITEAESMPSVQESAKEVQYAANRATSLTAQLLAFSRRQVSQPKVLDLNDVVQHSARMLARVIGEDIQIATHLEHKLGRVKVDPSQIDQLLLNLVVNARDAMPGGGKLTIETANVVLDDQYVGRHIGVKAGPYALLAVSDNGTGMTAEVRSRVFEPFFTTKEAGRGTGLGLSIVYGIVKQNGGEIMVYSEPGQGTTFKVYFPMAEVADDAMTAENGHAELQGTETILLCEDETGIRKLVKSMLVKRGYQVLEAEGPVRAMEISREFKGKIDLLLTDVVMPEMSGFDLAGQLMPVRPEMKVLYTSGYTDNRLVGTWTLKPGVPFLQKPFTAGTLSQKVREALTGVTSDKTTPKRA